MNGRRAILGLCALLALALSAVAAQGAAAASKGTTGFTCVEKAGGFTDAHCKSVGSGNFSHVEIPENTPTEGIGTNETTNGERQIERLKATIAGSAIELTAKIVEAQAVAENKKDPVTGEHYSEGEGKSVFKEVTETKLGCEVVGLPGGKGVIETKQLTATTKGQGDAGKLSPKSGTVFAEFELKGCVVAATYKVVGSLICPSNGVTGACNHAETTALKTLRLNSAVGPVVGVEGTGTAKARAVGSGGAYTTLSVTTVETP
jgi:hypothetical protein